METVKAIFYRSVQTGEFKSDFDLLFGNNGVILRPKKKELKKLCIKSPLRGQLKALKSATQSFEMTEEERKIFEEVMSEKGVLTYSITRDIENYEEIQKNEELLKYVPHFYYYEFDKGHDFIIMDFIDGQYQERLGTINCNDTTTDPLIRIYCMFKKEGFVNVDRIEAIFNHNTGQHVLIDLGGFLKIPY